MIIASTLSDVVSSIGSVDIVFGAVDLLVFCTEAVSSTSVGGTTSVGVGAVSCGSDAEVPCLGSSVVSCTASPSAGGHTHMAGACGFGGVFPPVGGAVATTTLEGQSDVSQSPSNSGDGGIVLFWLCVVGLVHSIPCGSDGTVRIILLFDVAVVGGSGRWS